jgi:hypothetical protein
MQYIIDFKNETPSEIVQAYLAEHNCLVKSVFSSFAGIYVVEAEAMPPQTDIVEAIIEDEANPIELLSTFEVETDAAADWWKIASAYKPDLNADSQTYERRGKDATIYLVDSGIESSHEEFAEASIVPLFSFNGDFTDTRGHGTALASVMVGTTCGMSSATVKDVKVFHSGVPTLQSHLLAAFDAIIQDVAQNQNTLAIVNLSWSIPKNEYIESKIRILVEAGVAVICAAGNNGIPISDVTPASMEEVFVVGAYNEDLEPCNFSNYTGDLSFTRNQVNTGAIDVWGPGSNIPVALIGGGIGITSGTSIASAIQAAACAYNSYIFALSDGTVPAMLEDGTMVFGFSSSKKDILTLEGEYASSINRMTNYHTEIDGQNGLNHRVSTKMRLLLISGQPIQKILFPQNVVASTDLTTEDLPEGLYLDNAWVLGNKIVNEPLIWTKDFTYTKHNGTVVDVNIQILILPEGQSLQDVNDPTLQMTFSESCTGSAPVESAGYWYCDSGTCAGGGTCYDACMAFNKAGGGPAISGPGGLTGYAAASALEADCQCYFDSISPCGG